MTLPPPPQPKAAVATRGMVAASRTLSALLLGLCALLVALSVYNFTLYCENFGCLGKGLLWMVWAVATALGWLAALAVRAWQRRRGLGTRASGVAWGVLSVLGAGHALYWLGTTVLP